MRKKFKARIQRSNVKKKKGKGTLTTKGQNNNNNKKAFLKTDFLTEISFRKKKLKTYRDHVIKTWEREAINAYKINK